MVALFVFGTSGPQLDVRRKLLEKMTQTQADNYRSVRVTQLLLGYFTCTKKPRLKVDYLIGQKSTVQAPIVGTL